MVSREKKEFILSWIDQYTQANILDAALVDAYVEKFNAKVIVHPFGANKCPELGKTLAEMYRTGELNRYSLGVSGLGYGFPKWTYCYERRY